MKRYLTLVLLFGSACQMSADLSTASPVANTQPSLHAYGTDASTEPVLGPDGRPPAIVSCYTAASSSHPATQAFWSALTEADYSARDQVVQQLTAAAAAQPAEEELTFLLAHAHMWRAAEAQSISDWLVALDSAQQAERNFELAYALCPTDHRILAWLAPMKIMLGGMLLDNARLEEGARMLEDGIERYPLFIMFSNIVAYGRDPEDSPGFQRALDTARYYLKFYDRTDTHCVEHPDDKACINSARVPHNREGTALFMGDVFVKAKDRASALESYQFIDVLPDAQHWAFRETVQARIQNLDQNLAAAATATELDDLSYAWNFGSTCMYCHQR